MYTMTTTHKGSNQPLLGIVYSFGRVVSVLIIYDRVEQYYIVTKADV